MIKLGKKSIDIGKFFVGARLSLVFCVIFVISFLGIVIFSPIYYSGRTKEGEISLRSVYAPYDFEYPWGINEEKTKEATLELLKSVPATFDIDNNKEEEALRNLNLFFDNIKGVKEVKAAEERSEVFATISKKSNISVQDETIVFFSEVKNAGEVKAKLVNILSSIYPLGIINSTTKQEFVKEGRAIKIRNQRLKSERIRPVGEVFNPDEARKIAAEYATRVFAKNTKLKNYSSALISTLISQNLVFNETATNADKEEVLRNATPIYNKVDVKKNELIVDRGERITKKHIAQLTQLGTTGGMTKKGPYFLGILILCIILIGAGIIYLFLIEKKIISSPKEVAIILINSFVILLIGQFIIQSPQVDYVIPLSGLAMLITLLISPNVALLVTLILSILFGIMAGGKIEIILVLLSGGFTGSYVVRDARHRSRIILAGLLAGMASMVTIISIGFLNNLGFRIFMYDALWGLGGNIFSIFLVLGLLPFFEYAFKVITNITLLELSDPNHPLLRELTLRAPGTYQHSVVVGNLAETACEAIGANSLLARIGAYYHDIGKVEKAEYFSENEMGARSKHEKLTPSMSALVIINHVKNAIELAKKHNLNRKIIDFIEQHHGTSLIYYFYQRALEKVMDDEILKEEEFRYPGPKPQTREAAVVLLADSVEASTRALRDPTPARIRSLVQKIINNKFIDNQLDECDLTLKDLNKISESFVRILTAIFHARLEYPEKNNNGMKKANDKDKRRKPK